MVWCVPFPQDVKLESGCVLAIGNFDGVHAGHRALLDLAGAEAQARGVPLVVLTFEPHPRSVLFPHLELKRLTAPEEKVALLGEAGAAGVAVLSFNLEVAGWSPQRFLDEVVVGWLGAVCVCVGENFRFGHKAAGDVETLRADGRFGVRVAELLRDEGGVVSSRRLRES